jgi:ABC-type antimicrobial peptide transport system permease subunit
MAPMPDRWVTHRLAMRTASCCRNQPVPNSEIGVRIALGAAPSAMQGRILTQTMILAAIGLTIGLPVAAIAAKSIQGLLFGVIWSDAATFGGVGAVVVIVAAFAGYVPARRASRIDPVLALRSE